MGDLLVRALMVVPVATLLPLGLPSVPSRPVRMAIAGGLALAALATGLEHWQSWAIVAIAVAVAAVPVRDRNRPWPTLVATLVALVVVVLLTDAGLAVERLVDLADDRRVIAIVTGGLACIFLGGALIGALLHPLAMKTRDVGGMENAGRLIGWIERALLYGLVLVGAPGAAALVIAGKSIARFPAFEDDGFAEYYLIGSLLSLSIAFGIALAVRAVIGLDPVAPL